MTTQAQPLPHITCQEFCGAPIYDSEKDHLPDCGAPLAERKRIADELRALKFRTAADSVGADVEVDAQAAKLRRGPAREQVQEKPPWRDPQVLEAWVYAAQKAIDDEEQIIGGMGTASKCPGKEMIEGVELDCPHTTMIKGIEVRECSEHTKHRKKIWQMCLIHTIRALAAGIAPAGLGPLFDSNGD